MKMKKLVLGTATVLLSLGMLAGCGKGSAEKKGAGSDDTTKLTMWHFFDGVYLELLEEQIDTFNETVGKEKGIEVEPVFQAWPATQPLVAAMSADDTSNMPDIIQLSAENVNTVRDFKRTVWAEDYITKSDSNLKKEDLVPNMVGTYSIDDKMIGVPYSTATLLMYYNKDMLSQAGVSEPPKTIAEMAKVMDQLAAKTDLTNTLNVEVKLFELENWIATQGKDGSYLGNNASGHDGYATELLAAKDGTLENYLEAWQKVTDAKGYKPVSEADLEEFAAGDTGMLIMSSSRIRTVDEMVGDSFEWGVAQIPLVNADDLGGAVPNGAGLFMIDRDDQKKIDASWTFLEYLSSPEVQAGWLKGTGYVPTNVHTKDTEDYKKYVEEEPKLSVPYELLLHSNEDQVVAFMPNSSEINRVIKETMARFGKGEINADEAFKEINTQSEKLIADYYEANPIKE